MQQPNDATLPTGTTVTIEAPQDVLADLRNNAVLSEVANYGARRNYAAGINRIADATLAAWFEDGAPEHAAVAAEKKRYYKELKAIGYSNPSNAWKMVKLYAREDAQKLGLWGMSVPEPAAEGTEGANEGASEGNTRHTRSLDLRALEDITGLYKAYKREFEKGLTAKQNTVYLKLAGILTTDFGVDLGQIK